MMLFRIAIGVGTISTRFAGLEIPATLEKIATFSRKKLCTIAQTCLCAAMANVCYMGQL